MKEDNHIIEITPELNRRVQVERRREPRERIAALERRLASIAEVCENCGMEADLVTLEQIYRLAKGTHV
jgi:DNA-binding protein H-NS